MQGVARRAVIESTDGVHVPLYDLEGAGPPLLVGHATGFHGLMYGRLVEALGDFRCWSADLRGHGDATAPRSMGFAWEGFADDLGAVVAHLAPSVPLFGFGHSMGASALLMVEQRCPGTFAALYCYEPVVYPPDVPNDAERVQALANRTRRRRASFPSRHAALENYRSKPPYKNFDSRVLEAFVDHGFAGGANGELHLKCRPEWEAEIYRMGPMHRTFERLGEVACPVTIGRGARLEPGPSHWAEALAAALPEGRLVTFDGLGHLGPCEDPQRVALEVRSAFTGVAA